jgi:Trehalose utilization protein
MNVTIWNEFHPSARVGKTAHAYPYGIHDALKSIFKDESLFTVTTATQEQAENGLPDRILDSTDVLIWWGHQWHDKVLETVADKVVKRVLAGMGLIVLHSAHMSKPFKKLMGTTCTLKWRENDEKERLWVVDPTHPIAMGIPETFTLQNEETYGEVFDVPAPDETVFLGWFAGGEVFRSGITFKRGRGKIFYFQPGHETYPIYFNETIRRVIFNAAVWAAPGSPLKIPDNYHQKQAPETTKKGFFSSRKEKKEDEKNANRSSAIYFTKGNREP